MIVFDKFTIRKTRTVSQSWRHKGCTLPLIVPENNGSFFGRLTRLVIGSHFRYIHAFILEVEKVAERLGVQRGRANWMTQIMFEKMGTKIWSMQTSKRAPKLTPCRVYWSKSIPDNQAEIFSFQQDFLHQTQQDVGKNRTLVNLYIKGHKFLKACMKLRMWNFF